MAVSAMNHFFHDPNGAKVEIDFDAAEQAPA